MEEVRAHDVAGEAFYRYQPASDRDSLYVRLVKSDLRVIEAQGADGLVTTRLERDPDGLRLLFLRPEAEASVRRLSEAVQFLPKVSWRLPHTEMLLSGFRSGKWHGLALEDPRSSRLVSYLDYTWKAEEIEIGFCMTHPDWRGRRLVTRLLASLLLLYFDYSFRISTHEANHAMSGALRHFGFTVTARLPKDRVNGETTHYLVRAPWTAFSLRR